MKMKKLGKSHVRQRTISGGLVKVLQICVLEKKKESEIWRKLALMYLMAGIRA